MKHLLIGIILCFNPLFSSSQSNPEDKLGSWFTYSGIHRVTEKISINTCAQIWLYEVDSNFNFMLLNTGISYHISPKFTTSISYGYADIDGGLETNAQHTFENRIYEQIAYKHNILKLPIDHRIRIEHRFLNTPNENKTKHRLRYRLGTKIKLNNNLFIRLNNEFLATFQNDIGTENRLYGALGIHIFKSSNVQLGYLNRKINGLNLHRLQVGVSIKTDLRRK